MRGSEWRPDPTVRPSWIFHVSSCKEWGWSLSLYPQLGTSCATQRLFVLNWLREDGSGTRLKIPYLNQDQFGALDRISSIVDDIGVDDDVFTWQISSTWDVEPSTDCTAVDRKISGLFGQYTFDWCLLNQPVSLKHVTNKCLLTYFYQVSLLCRWQSGWNWILGARGRDGQIYALFSMIWWFWLGFCNGCFRICLQKTAQWQRAIPAKSLIDTCPVLKWNSARHLWIRKRKFHEVKFNCKKKKEIKIVRFYRWIAAECELANKFHSLCKLSPPRNCSRWTEPSLVLWHLIGFLWIKKNQQGKIADAKTGFASTRGAAPWYKSQFNSDFFQVSNNWNSIPQWNINSDGNNGPISFEKSRTSLTANFLRFIIRDVNCAGQALTSWINPARIIQDDIQFLKSHFKFFFFFFYVLFSAV